MFSSLFARTAEQNTRADDRAQKYFNKPIWSLSPDPAFLAPPKFDSVKPTISKSKLFGAHPLAEATMEDPFAQSTNTKSYFADQSNLVEASAVSAAIGHVGPAWHDSYGCHSIVSFPSPASTPESLLITKLNHKTPWSTMGFRSGTAEHQAFGTYCPSSPKLRALMGSSSFLVSQGPLVPPGLGPPRLRSDRLTEDGSLLDGHSTALATAEAIRRTGEILVQCGVLTTLETPMPPLPTAVLPTLGFSNYRLGFTVEHVAHKHPEANAIEDALARWSSDMLYSLAADLAATRVLPIVHSMGPSSACQSVAKRIRQVLRDIHCPELVVIHAFWYILQLTSSADDKASAFTFYHFLYQHGARTVDEVMLHAFIAAAMISDKWVNDHSFAAKTWRKFSGIPVATLNTTEIFMLKRLAWKTEIPTDQWRPWLEQLQNWGGSTARNGSLPQGSASPRAIVDIVLDHMLLQDVARSHAPQPHHSVPHTIGHAPDAPLHAYKSNFIAAVPSLPGPADWCPEADPVVEPTTHRQPVSFAPGAHRISVGQLSHDIASFPHTPPAFQYGRSMPLGTSFTGPFGAIGTRLANGLTSVHNGPWLATASRVPWITAQG